MKRFLLLAVLALATAFSVRAQDMITCTDGSEYIVTILEVKTDGVYFKYFGEPESQTYRLPESSILMISYANGQTFIFPAGYQVLENMARTSQVPEPVPVQKKRCCLFRCCKKR